MQGYLNFSYLQPCYHEFLLNDLSSLTFEKAFSRKPSFKLCDLCAVQHYTSLVACLQAHCMLSLGIYQWFIIIFVP